MIFLVDAGRRVVDAAVARFVQHRRAPSQPVGDRSCRNDTNALLVEVTQQHIALEAEFRLRHRRAEVDRAGRGVLRSEEHTSELQSLMRISYAVFCLKKKNKKHET